MHTLVQDREKTAETDRWNVEALFPSLESWEKDLSKIVKENERPRWPELLAYKEHLGDNSETLQKALEYILMLDRELSKLYTYAHLRHDEDIANDSFKKSFIQIVSLLHDLRQETAWFEPELLALPEEKIRALINAKNLAPYRFYLEKIVRLKPHTLPADQEELLALAGKALQSSHKAFSSINDADFKFGEVTDSGAQNHELTHASYGLMLRTQDRTLRKNAFVQYHRKYLEFENTLAELLTGKIEVHIFNAKARHYSSALEAALFPNQIDLSVYHSLIKSVNANLDALHDYVELRKRILNLDSLHYYDLYVPLSKDVDIKMSYNEAMNAVIESAEPLGNEYQSLLRKGMSEQRWVDRFENKRKRSGAYSSGCYDSFPYILMNFKGTLRDVFTLAHEAGHSMHSLLSNKTQSYQDSSYPIFLAEVASTFNEALLTKYLLERAKSDKERFYLINQQIEDIRATLFRQAQFAEFELWLHQTIEANTPLTPGLIKERYLELNKKYFGDALVLDPEVAIEWARIPHFYYNFYVYQYSTGISAALALSEKVLNGGKKEQESYLAFLKSGCSDYPINLLAKTGIDMRSSEPVEAAIGKFRALVKQLKTLEGAK